MRQLSRDQITEASRPARRRHDASRLASEVIRMARLATAVHLRESARLMTARPADGVEEVER